VDDVSYRKIILASSIKNRFHLVAVGKLDFTAGGIKYQLRNKVSGDLFFLIKQVFLEFFDSRKLLPVCCHSIVRVEQFSVHLTRVVSNLLFGQFSAYDSVKQVQQHFDWVASTYRVPSSWKNTVMFRQAV